MCCNYTIGLPFKILDFGEVAVAEMAFKVPQRHENDADTLPQSLVCVLHHVQDNTLAPFT